MPRIRSIIEIHHGGEYSMDNVDEKAELQPVEHEEKSDGSLSSNSEKKSHHYRSEAVSDRNRMFHKVRQRGQVNQNVEVSVKVEQAKDDCLSGCFKSILSVFKH